MEDVEKLFFFAKSVLIQGGGGESIRFYFEELDGWFTKRILCAWDINIEPPPHLPPEW